MGKNFLRIFCWVFSKFTHHDASIELSFVSFCSVRASKIQYHSKKNSSHFLTVLSQMAAYRTLRRFCAGSYNQLPCIYFLFTNTRWYFDIKSWSALSRILRFCVKMTTCGLDRTVWGVRSWRLFWATTTFLSPPQKSDRSSMSTSARTPRDSEPSTISFRLILVIINEIILGRHYVITRNLWRFELSNFDHTFFRTWNAWCFRSSVSTSRSSPSKKMLSTPPSGFPLAPCLL